MKQDILNREEFVNGILDFINLLSDNKKGLCFAVDGRWGTGKTFVLNMLEKRLREYQSEKTADENYYVFHYNCWQYDYYEEPSVAIVSAIMNSIDEELSLEKREAVKAAYEVAKEEVKKIAGEFLKNHIGINIIDLVDRVHGVNVDQTEKKNEFDDMFSFKKTLDQARQSFKKIAEKKTIVFVVDELDRCVPEYAIKVLERLHHFFDGIDNIIVLIAVDSEQLKHSVKEIYGIHTDVKDYLKKFISLTFKLDAGEIQEGVFNKYKSYFDMFELPSNDERENIEEIYKNIWYQKDIRTQEERMEKLISIHSLIGVRNLPLYVALYELIAIRFVESSNDIKVLKWIADINVAVFSGLKDRINEDIINYLKSLQKDACTGTTKISVEGRNRGDKMVFKNDLIGNTFLLLSIKHKSHYNYYYENRFDDIMEYIELFDKMLVTME